MELKFQHFLIFNFFGDFFKNLSILEVEIGINGPRILGVKNEATLKVRYTTYFQSTKFYSVNLPLYYNYDTHNTTFS